MTNKPTKICTKCKKEKPLGSFPKRKASRDGLGSYCTLCTKRYMTEYRKKNREKLAALNVEYYKKNREKIAAQTAEYRKKNREKIYEYRKKNREKIAAQTAEYRKKNHKRYHMKNLNQLLGPGAGDYYYKKLTEQDGCCAICGDHEILLTKRLALDHNHDTGQLRGLLCGICNSGIGHLKDNINILRNAITYLEKYENE